MQNSTLVWIIIIALIVLGGGWYFVNSQSTAEEATGALSEEGNTTDTSGTAGVGARADVEIGGSNNEESTAPMTASVTYTSGGFSPSTITIKKGGTVTWKNQGGGEMWVASAQHPTHTAYDGTTREEHCVAGSNSFDQCVNGSAYSFIFDKAGTWRYHNHSNSSHFGTVIVEE